MKSGNREFVLKEDYDNKVGVVQYDIKSEKIIENLKNSLEISNRKVQTLCRKMSKHAHAVAEYEEYLHYEDDTDYHGLIYLITDVDLPERGKIGRTMNTDVMKLRSRYTVFGHPNILCFLSTDIKTDENDLKKLLREAGCMKSNTELISNVSMAMRLFNDFVIDRFSMRTTMYQDKLNSNRQKLIESQATLPRPGDPFEASEL
jgi:hypothetical protein